MTQGMQQGALPETERALQQAVQQHQAGQLQIAENLYRKILHLNPNQPDANHNLGVLAVQCNQPECALPYLLTALKTDPTREQYWISYIDALLQAGRLEDAGRMIALARQQGLADEAMTSLTLRLESCAKPASDIQPAPSALDAEKDKPKLAASRKIKPSSKEVKALSDRLDKRQYPEAIHLAKIMTEHYPMYPYGWKALGTALEKTGQPAASLSAMQKAAELSPGDAEPYNHMGNTQLNLGRANEAAASYRTFLKIRPGDAAVHCNLGVALRQMGFLADAESSYRRAMKINPHFAEAHNNLGNTLKDLGRYEEAEASFRHALRIRPSYAEALNNLGATLKELRKYDDAVVCFRQALSLNPAYAEAHNNLGYALRELGKLDQALASCRHALELKPDYADAHNNLGGILKEMGKIDESMASCLRALEIKPDFAVAYNNLGTMLLTRGDTSPAIDSYSHALALQPDYILARVNLGYAQLACGQLSEGWKNHEYRTCINKTRFPYTPYWSGEPLQDRTILIWGEQGIGDEIMFASLFPEIIEQAGHCIIECAPKLVPLFTRSFPDAQIIEKTTPPHPATQSGIDYQCASGSLALWLRPMLTSFPQKNNFLMADPTRVACWKNRFASLGPGPKIGINWRSSQMSCERNLHYTTLDQWGPIFHTQGVHFINLQYDECSAELNEARLRFVLPLHAFPEVDMYNDLDETAALIQALDLVICAPTTVSSIAAGLGINTWVMAYGVIWATHGTDHDLWFPSLHYFRRRWDQPWEEIIGQVAGQAGHLEQSA